MTGELPGRKAPPGLARTTSISISRCSLLAFSFSSFSSPWYSTCEPKEAQTKEQGTKGLGWPESRHNPIRLSGQPLTSMSFCFCRWSSIRLLVTTLSFSQSPCTCRMALWTWPSSSSSCSGKDRGRLPEAAGALLP